MDFITMKSEAVQPAELFTSKEVADILGIRHRQVYAYDRRGDIKPSLYVHGRPRYSIDAIEACINKINKPIRKQKS